jgi:hypothetical protein
MKIIETSSRTNLMSWLVYSSFGLMCLVGTPIVFIKLALNEDKNLLNLIPLFILQIFIGVLCLRMILWFIKGKETVILENNQLLIMKFGTFWIKRKKVVDLQNIKEIVVNRSFIEENSPSTLVHDFSRQTYIFSIQNTGRIKIIDNESNEYKFMDNLDTENEALQVIERIKNVCVIE